MTLRQEFSKPLLTTPVFDYETVKASVYSASQSSISHRTFVESFSKDMYALQRPVHAGKKKKQKREKCPGQTFFQPLFVRRQ